MCWGFLPASRQDGKHPNQAQGSLGRTGLRGAQRQGSPCCTDISQGSHELLLMSRPWVGHRSVLPLHPHSPSQLLSSQHRVGRFEPARLRGLVTSSSGHRQSSGATHWRGMRRPSNFPGAPYHRLGFLGCHSRPKEVPTWEDPRAWARKRGWRTSPEALPHWHQAGGLQCP